MADNYQAWQIRVPDFNRPISRKEKIAFLLNFAVLAPSSHNSQPWKFVTDDTKIILSPEFSRALPVSDTNYRQLYISLGCALQNILIASKYYGLGGRVEYFPNDAERIVVSFEQEEAAKDIKDDRLISATLTRHTNRNKYSSRLPDDKFLSQIRAFSSEDFRIDIFGVSDKKDKIADIVLAANISATEDAGFRRELSNYVKNNFTRSKIGMPMFGFGMPSPVSFIAPWVVRNFNVNKLSQKEDGRLLKEFTPTFVLISAKRDDKDSWVRGGQIFEEVALLAEKEGLKTAPMAAAIQIGEFYKDLQNVLMTDFRPLVFCRLGYCDKITKHSPRLMAGDVLK